MAVNKVMLVGNVGKDPEVRYLDNGTPVANFTLATSESYKNKNGERVKSTEWHNIVLWRGLAEVAEKYVKKGTMVYIEGKLRNRSWDDKEGNKRYITEIVADNMQMLSRKSDDENPGGVTQSANNTPQAEASNDSMETFNNLPTDSEVDDLPF